MASWYVMRRRAVMRQSWMSLTFLHWRYRPEDVRRLLPADLELDTFDGSAWVAVAPFLIEGLGPVGIPAPPWLGRFPETNCRTYVRGPDGGSGVWFFSLDAARAAAVMGGRLFYGLPYMWARMRMEIEPDRVVYRSSRLWPDRAGSTDIEIEPGQSITTDEMAAFLTARYRLYSVMGGRLACAEVEHTPWPLQSGQVVRMKQTLTAAAGLPEPSGEPLVYFSPGVHVRVAAPYRVKMCPA
jgi:uncharacterized protein YqjF (DUF2071 family)